MNAQPRLVIIGVGNPDRGDDGVGAAVVRALSGRLPEAVDTRVRSGDMLGLIEDWAHAEAVICIDAAASLGSPGRIHRVDVDEGELPPEAGLASSHAFGLAEAIALSRALGSRPRRMIVYAVEGDEFEVGAPLGVLVAEAVEAVVLRVVAEVAQLLSEANVHA